MGLAAIEERQGLDDMIVYDETEAAIAVLAKQYEHLEVKGREDKDGFRKVRAARIDVKNRRTKVEKRRKELKADALEYGRKVDARAKELTGLLLQIEAPLKENEDWYTAEQERLKKEEEERQAAALQARLDALAAVDGALPVLMVQAMSEEEYAEALATATQKHEIEQARIAAEKAAEEARLAAERLAREEEEKRLEAIRAEQEKQARALREAQEKLDAEKRALEERERAEKERAEREAQDARLAQETAARAAQEERERIAREQAERELAEERAKEEAARQEALRPDCEKIRAYATALLDVPVPTIVMPEAQELVDTARKSLLRLTTALTKGAEGL